MAPADDVLRGRSSGLPGAAEFRIADILAGTVRHLTELVPELQSLLPPYLQA